MSRFEDRAENNQYEIIRDFIKSLGYEQISDSSSQNHIFKNDNSVIIIRKKL